MKGRYENNLVAGERYGNVGSTNNRCKNPKLFIDFVGNGDKKVVLAGGHSNYWAEFIRVFGADAKTCKTELRRKTLQNGAVAALIIRGGKIVQCYRVFGELSGKNVDDKKCK